MRDVCGKFVGVPRHGLQPLAWVRGVRVSQRVRSVCVRASCSITARGVLRPSPRQGYRGRREHGKHPAGHVHRPDNYTPVRQSHAVLRHGPCAMSSPHARHELGRGFGAGCVGLRRVGRAFRRRGSPPRRSRRPWAPSLPRVPGAQQARRSHPAPPSTTSLAVTRHDYPLLHDLVFPSRRWVRDSKALARLDANTFRGATFIGSFASLYV